MRRVCTSFCMLGCVPNAALGSQQHAPSFHDGLQVASGYADGGTSLSGAGEGYHCSALFATQTSANTRCCTQRFTPI
jgi:hypothetical protein